MPGERFDLVVVGGGVMGLAAAYYAARAGKSVLVLEQFEFFNQRGSSKGDSRFFRVMYSDRMLSLLAQASDPLWRELESESGVRLRDMNGLLFWGTPSGVNTPEGNLPGCKEVMDELGILYEEYPTPAALQRAYPVLGQLPDKCIGLYQADAGVIHAEETYRVLFQLGQQFGVIARSNERVFDIVPGDDENELVTVVTEAARYYSHRLVLAPGAWTNDVLRSFGLHLDLKIWEMTVCYYSVQEPQQFPYPLWFYFGLPSGDDGGTYYSIPPVGESGVKVSTDFTNRIVDSPADCTHVPDERILKLIRRFVGSHLNGLSQDTIPGSAHTCNYTVAPDFGFVLDFIPGHRNIVLFTGEGGQAFKFTPLIGVILAELALAGTTRYNISEFSIDRPGIVTKRARR